jgi:hypothetical protein
MTQISLTGTALRIASTTGLEIFGQNNGVGNIYLSSTPDVSNTLNSTVVNSGGSFTWPGGKDLYACTDVGNTALLNYMNNGATATSGTVTTTASNSPTLLYTDQLNISSNAGLVFKNSLKDIDVSSYSSIIARLEYSTAHPVVSTNYITLSLSQNTELQGVTKAISVDPAQFLLLQSGINSYVNSYQIPVQDHYLNYYLAVQKDVTAENGVLVLKIYGTHEIIAQKKYVHKGNGLLGYLTDYGSDGYQDGAGTSARYLSSTNGPHVFTLFPLVAGAGGFADIKGYINGTDTFISGLYVAPNSPIVQSVSAYPNFPCTPISLVVQNQGAAGTLLATMIT